MAALKTFLGLDQTPFDQAKVVVIPRGYDGTASYGKGMVNGPDAMLDASQQMEVYDEELGTEAYEMGIHTLPVQRLNDRTPEQAVASVETDVARVVNADKFPLLLGGEHSLTAGAMRPVAKRFPELTVLYFDAHPDLRDAWTGTKYSHACAARRCLELGVNLVQVGVRAISRDDADVHEIQPERVTWFPAMEKNAWTPAQVAAACGPLVYVSFDVDALDASLMPATGTPVPGGLSWNEATGVLRAVAQKSRIVGADVMELAPVPGMHAYDFTAARLAYKLAAYAFEQQRAHRA